MESSIRTTYLLHPVGRADLGAPPGDPGYALETDLVTRMSSENDQAVKRLLRLQLPEQNAGTAAPLAAALRGMPEDVSTSDQLHLIVMSTGSVFSIAEAIAAGLRRAPDSYGREFDAVTVLCADNLEETAVTGTLTRYLGSRVGPDDYALVTWGSGSSQVNFAMFDAVLEVGLRASLLRTSPEWEVARHEVYDPAPRLKVDTRVPLLRRWRYHDLLWQLAESDELTLTEPQRAVLAREAKQWGQAYLAPTADRLQAVMAAALMRHDGSSGFAVRAYVTYRYRELLSAGEPDLIEWAERKLAQDDPRRHPTLGTIRGTVQRETSDRRVANAKTTEAGQWLLGDVVGRLNDMGNYSSHELETPQPPHLEALRDHLAECAELVKLDENSEEESSRAGLSRLSLVPSSRAWYVAVVGRGENERGADALDSIANAANDPETWHRLDHPVRRYLGIPDQAALPIGLFAIGTRSASADAAFDLAERWRGTLPTVSMVIEDREMVRGVDPDAVTVDGLVARLSADLPPDAGALVVVPTGPKQYVLPLLLAGQVVAAERGIPQYLRQIVDRGRSIVDAGIHRLPLRFGADRAMLHAVLHALDGGELDTAGRLLGAMGVGRTLGDRLLALARALRCADASQPETWPAEVRRDRSSTELRHPLLAERIEVWANRPSLDDDPTVGMQAIVGACACADASTRRTRSKPRRVLADLYAVRDKLPITHGEQLDDRDLAGLVSELTDGRHTTVTDLLQDAVAKARACYGSPTHSNASLSQLVCDLRADIAQLLDERR